MQKLLVALMLGTIAFAGCLSSDETSNDPDLPTQGNNDPAGYLPPSFKNPIIADHDHNDPEFYPDHDIANNIAEIAYHPLREGTIATISELDAAGGYVFVAEMGFGFHIYNVADPMNPVLESSTLVETPDQQSPLGLYMADLKVDATGDWVFVATELSTTPGVLIYDARDKTNPVLAGFWPEPGLLLGCHMIEYWVQDEQEYVACAPLDNAIYIGMLLPPVGPVREIVQVARWMPETTEFAEHQTNMMIEYAQAQDPASAALHWVSGHQDMTYQVDALTGTPMLTVSFWNLGLHWLDVTVPQLPTTLGAWYAVDSESYAGNLHTAMLYFDGDRRIAVAIPEGAQPPTVFTMDATVLTQPEILSEWTPLDENGNKSRFSMHNFQILDGKIYLTMYHGGIWVLDISDAEKQADPEIVGTVMPFDRRAETYGRGINSGIMSWDLVVVDGYIWTANEGGFFGYLLEGDPAGDELYDSQA